MLVNSDWQFLSKTKLPVDTRVSMNSQQPHFKKTDGQYFIHLWIIMYSNDKTGRRQLWINGDAGLEVGTYFGKRRSGSWDNNKFVKVRQFYSSKMDPLVPNTIASWLHAVICFTSSRFKVGRRFSGRQCCLLVFSIKFVFVSFVNSGCLPQTVFGVGNAH